METRPLKRRPAHPLKDSFAVGAVRAFADLLLREAQAPAEPRDDARVVVSELCTNALNHAFAKGMPIPLCFLTPGSRSLLIEVWDHLPWQPLTPIDTAASEESGRGLAIVADLSSAWGCRPSTRGGKCVWATLRW